MKFQGHFAFFLVCLILTAPVRSDTLVRVKLDKRAANGTCAPLKAESFDKAHLANVVGGSSGEPV